MNNKEEEQNMTKLLTKNRSFYKDFFLMTLILALQNLITCSVNLADNIMLGSYAEGNRFLLPGAGAQSVY